MLSHYHRTNTAPPTSSSKICLKFGNIRAIGKFKTISDTKSSANEQKRA